MLLALNVHVLIDATFMFVVTPATVILKMQSQKKDVSPEKVQIKPVKDASFVDLSPSTPPLTNVLSVVDCILVGARLQNFWQVLAAKGLNPRVVLILKERYSLKFKIKPSLTRE